MTLQSRHSKSRINLSEPAIKRPPQTEKQKYPKKIRNESKRRTQFHIPQLTTADAISGGESDFAGDPSANHCPELTAASVCPTQTQ